MTTMHPEGPWLMCESATHVTVTNAHGDAVFHDDKRIPGVMADARLIAAAPDLLEALRGMFAMWRSVCRAQGWEPEHLAEAVRAQAAIAKATGEQL